MPEALLVEDSPDQAAAFHALLESAGWTVRAAGHGRAALDELEHGLPDVVITDLHMPQMDGLELVEAAAARYPRMPVVLITAFGSEETAARALRSGALSYIPKERIFDDLPGTLQRIVDLVGDRQDRSRVLSSLVASEQLYELANDATLIGPLVRAVEEMLMARFGEERMGRIYRVGVALSEAIVNAMHHGNLEAPSELRERDHAAYRALLARRQLEAPYCDRRVRVTVRLAGSGLALRVEDDGAGYPEGAFRKPDDPANLVRLSGRGLYLISTFMDRVSHNDRRNAITMELDLAGHGAPVD